MSLNNYNYNLTKKIKKDHPRMALFYFLYTTHKNTPTITHHS